MKSNSSRSSNIEVVVGDGRNGILIGEAATASSVLLLNDDSSILLQVSFILRDFPLL